ncbi:uncharacterized protein LOC133995953 [Scomber scombrus]|uniref:uncharacterized protein LOC133995953 n=1 Tax=Scomber scombrus TaxID=13677 RepID=UPI002DD8AFE6|nr:uncharacterized protein LOC133995953 [Scomber scombrus]
MKTTIGRLRAPTHTAAMSVQKSLQSFSLQYTYPKCPEPKHITDMDPSQNTVEDLMLRICHLESIGSSKGVCLYTVDGMPLTDDPFFNTWSLEDRHIKSGDVIYAIFTPKENLNASPQNTTRPLTETSRKDTVRCHVMLKGDFEVKVNLATDTISDLKNKLANESGIPAHVLHYKGGDGGVNALESCGISEGTIVHFSLSSFAEKVPDTTEFFSNDVVPSVQQTPKGISVFLSSLYVIKNQPTVLSHKNLIGYIRKLTGCNPLAQSLYQLLMKNRFLSRTQKIAVVEGLYTLFRELLPKLGSKRGEKIIEDLDVFENSTYCWAFLMTEAKIETADHEDYAPVSLMSEDNKRFFDPVTIPGVPGVLEKAFHIDTEKTFGNMAEELKELPQLNVTPPLLLKDLGFLGPNLVFLSADNLGVYMHKDKATPAMIKVYDCLAGKVKDVDVDELAAKTGDHRDDQSLDTTRTPKEAILVLIDTSSSMSEVCYESVEIQKIHAVKELFDNFATRSMAYDFHHVIGLVKFDSTVTTLHTFTETLEKFKS